MSWAAQSTPNESFPCHEGAEGWGIAYCGARRQRERRASLQREKGDKGRNNCQNHTSKSLRRAEILAPYCGSQAGGGLW